MRQLGRSGSSRDFEAAMRAADRAVFKESAFISCCVGLGYFVLGFALQIFGRWIEPVPGISVGYTVSAALVNAAELGAVMAILVLIDVDFQRGMMMPKPDWSFYPRFRLFREWFSKFWAAAILIAGFGALAVYWANSLSPSDVLQTTPGSQPVWVRDRMFVSGMSAWGIFWLADCACRPEPGTRIAAVGLLVCAVAAAHFCLTEFFR